jgi:hypothetical protein
MPPLAADSLSVGSHTHPTNNENLCCLISSVRREQCRTTKRIEAHKILSESTFTRNMNCEIWSKSLGVTPDELKTAVSQVGDSAEAVRKHLGK